VNDHLLAELGQLTAAAAAADAKVTALDARTAAVQQRQYELQEQVLTERSRYKVRGVFLWSIVFRH
jgi:2-polyprenyl-3-methyl-5-hydroxy-6-metoxy-1,4-benzoquinol methylase